MRKFLSSIVIASIAFLSVTASAAPMPPVGQWQCFANNNHNARWFANANKRKHAMHRARQRCYAAGSHKCYVGKDQCRYNDGNSWTCRVQDHRGRVWKRTGQSAKAACKTARHACSHWHNRKGINNYMCAIVSEHRT